MILGGFDIELAGAVIAGNDMNVVLRSLRGAWPQAIVETSDGTSVITIATAITQRWSAPCEVFIYEHRASYESWTANGLTVENANEMIAVAVESDGMSFVVNDPNAPTVILVRELMDAVTQNRWLALAA